MSEKTVIKRAARLEATPESAKRLFSSCWSKKASPRQAIKAQCLECQGFDRDSITGCSAPACPLFEYRPYQKSKV